MYSHERKWSPGWSEVEVIYPTMNTRNKVIIIHNPDSERPYSVQYRGNGHYFKTLQEARAYCFGRGFYPNANFVYQEDWK